MVSAVLDNATLAAAEISPVLSLEQMTGALVALLISGGMLIPGNIPNIIAAGKLGISMRDWAKTGVPLGLALMALFFGILFIPVWLVPEYCNNVSSESHQTVQAFHYQNQRLFSRIRFRAKNS